MANVFSLFTHPMRLIKQKIAISAQDIMLFFRHLSALFSAGIPLLRCLELLEQMQENYQLRIIIYTLKRDIQAGYSLSSSMKIFAMYFDALNCHLIFLAEQIGKLDEILLSIADRYETQLAFKQRIKQMLFYPCIVLIMTIVITLCLLIFVIPKFAELFASQQQAIPWISALLFNIAKKLNSLNFLIFCTISFVAIIFFHKQLWKYIIKNGWLYELPFTRQFYHQILLVRFIKSLALSLDAGVPLIEALHWICSSSLPKRFAIHLLQVRQHICSGKQLNQALAIVEGFPPLLIQLVSIGEEAGFLVSMLNKSALFLEQSLEQRIARLTVLLEPLIMSMLGVLIGGLIIGMYLPIFKLGNSL